MIPALVARRWRALVIAGTIMAATIVAMPWELYIEHRIALDAVMTQTWNGSAWRFPPMIPLVVVALWLLRHRGAEWLAIPAIWPGTQFYYHLFALAAVVGRPWLAAVVALPTPLLTPIAVIAYAAILERNRRRGAAIRGSST